MTLIDCDNEQMINRIFNSVKTQKNIKILYFLYYFTLQTRVN